MWAVFSEYDKNAMEKCFTAAVSLMLIRWPRDLLKRRANPLILAAFYSLLFV